MIREGRATWYSVLAFTLCLTAGRHAPAAFTQATCPSTQYDTPFPARLGTIEFDTSLNLAGTWYANSQHHRWPLLVNRNVKWIFARIGPNFDAETNWDYLKVFAASTYTYTGPFAPGYLLPWLVVSDTVGNHVDMQWHTDDDTTRQNQPHFDEVKVMCHSAVQPTSPMGALPRNQRVEGLLIKSGDVIYTSAWQTAATTLQVALDAPPNATTAGADFDLYVSTSTTMPDASNFMWRDVTVGASAYVAVPDSAYGRWVYIGARSASGAGQFTVHAYDQTATNRSTLKVCLNGTTIQNGLTAAVQNTMKASSAWLSQATQGQFRITRFNVASIPQCNSEYCNACDSTCNACMDHPAVNPDFCGFQTSGDGTVRFAYYTCGTYADPTGSGLVLAHEFGHALLGLPDEYYWDPVDSQAWCGHTFMNGPMGNSRVICTSLNHCQDGEWPPPAGCLASQSGWNLVGGRFPVIPGGGWSADPSRYLNQNGAALAAVTVTAL